MGSSDNNYLWTHLEAHTQIFFHTSLHSPSPDFYFPNRHRVLLLLPDVWFTIGKMLSFEEDKRMGEIVCVSDNVGTEKCWLLASFDWFALDGGGWVFVCDTNEYKLMSVVTDCLFVTLTRRTCIGCQLKVIYTKLKYLSLRLKAQMIFHVYRDN